jgi:hypothetical protein
LPDVFYSPAANGSLRQGEILTGLKQLVPSPGSVLEEPAARIIDHRYAVILSQDCDLEQDFNARFAGAVDPSKAKVNDRRRLLSIMFCDAIPADELKDRISDPRVWANAVMNKNERYHYLHEVGSEDDALGHGLPALGLDFKNYFTLPVDDAYAQAEKSKNRRAVLRGYYAEHLSVRFFFYQLRIALPKEHSAK